MVLDEGTRQERRYLAADVEALLSPLGIQVRTASDSPDSALVIVTPKNLSPPAAGPINTGTPDEDNAVPENASTVPSASQSPRLIHVESGIYQDVISRTYFERPFINGKRTWRSLKAKNLKFAREELHRRKSAVSSGKNPYCERKDGPLCARTVGDVIRLYQQDKYPDKHLNTRTESTRADEERNCETLLLFWDSIPVDSVSVATCDRYRDWRLKRIKRGKGLRTIDCELNTLNNAFRYGVRRELAQKNPLADRPKYQPSKLVVHCRQYMPGNADELHAAARHLFSAVSSEVLGFQLLFTAYTGQRTCELLRLRTDAGADEPGHVTQEGSCLRVWRAKGQDMVNPFCAVHEGLAALLKAHKAWLKARYPDSPWFFPGRSPDQVVDKGALAHALRRLKSKGLISRKITPHGGRAFFVTVRRSHGGTDSQIALEIGHTSGGSTLSAVYGGVPPDWIRGGGPQMAWLPSGAPAWSDLDQTY